MDGPPAQSLGVEPVDPFIMTRPPRQRNAPVLTKALLKRVFASAAFVMIGTLIVYVHEMSDTVDEMGKYIISPRDTTMTFTCFVLFDMFNALTCRSESKSILCGEIPLFGNRMFNFAVSGSLFGQALVVYVPLLQGIFQTEALYLSDWVALLCISGTVFWADELRKYLTRRRKRMAMGYSLNV